jgi:hypothetical protein
MVADVERQTTKLGQELAQLHRTTLRACSV